MNNTFKGMDPELAKQAMEKIVTKKGELDVESKSSSVSLKEKVHNAFAGTQTGAMDGYIERINAALENLYTYLDGNESNFAKTFNNVISSYEQSDENVTSSYDGSLSE